MNIVGGSNISSLLSAESNFSAPVKANEKLPPNRLNGSKEQKLETKNFNSALSEKTRPTESKPVESAKVESKETVRPSKKNSLVEAFDEKDMKKPVVLTEEQIMVNFLMAMKSEVGVEPKEVVEAMLNLSEESLLSPPEESVQLVIEQLNLSPKDEAKAEELYQVMLKETAEASMGRMLNEQNKSVDLKVIGPEQVRTQKVLESLDRMNQSFFTTDVSETRPLSDLQGKIRPEHEPEARLESFSGPVDSTYNEPKVTQKTVVNEFDRFVVPTRTLGDKPTVPLTQHSMETNIEPVQSLEFDSNFQTEFVQNTQSEMIDPVVLSEGMTNSEAMPVDDLLHQLKLQGFQVEQNLTSDPAVNSPDAITSEAVSVTPESSLAAFENGTERELGDRGEKVEIKDQAEPSQPQRIDSLLDPRHSTIRPGTPKVAVSDEAANVRNIVETAQVLATKGGGTMKIQLKPEGLGSVDLTVAVVNGKVDIQMVTESNEVKRLLESGLSDLKANLVQHKLSLENIKVDAPNLSSQLDSSLLGQDRESARQFLEQFRDFNRSRREAAFSDFGGVAGYGSKNKKLRPEDIQPTARAKNRRLDLVA